jgi:hypothetical protein
MVQESTRTYFVILATLGVAMPIPFLLAAIIVGLVLLDGTSTDKKQVCACVET